MTNGLKALGLLVFLVAMFGAFYGYANADPTDTVDRPDLNGVICGQLALGETPGEIADQIGSDPRVAWPSQRVWDAIPSCG